MPIDAHIQEMEHHAQAIDLNKFQPPAYEEVLSAEELPAKKAEKSLLEKLADAGLRLISPNEAHAASNAWAGGRIEGLVENAKKAASKGDYQTVIDMLEPEYDSLIKKGTGPLTNADMDVWKSLKRTLSDGYVLQSDDFFDKGETEKAGRAARKAVKIDNSYSDAHNNLGAYFIDKKQYDRAESEFKIAMELDPSSHSPFHNMGNLAIKRKQYDKAIKWSNEALRRNPNNSITYSNIGYALYFQGKIEESFEAYKTALSLNPNNKAAKAWIPYFAKKHNLILSSLR